MSTIEQVVYADLTTGAGATAMGNAKGYPLMIPAKATMPAWCYQRVAAKRETMHQGAQTMTTVVLQFTVQAATYGEAKALAEVIRARYHGVGRSTLGGITVHRMTVDSDQDGLADEDGATVRIDVTVFFTET